MPFGISGEITSYELITDKYYEVLLKTTWPPHSEDQSTKSIYFPSPKLIYKGEPENSIQAQFTIGYTPPSIVNWSEATEFK